MKKVEDMNSVQSAKQTGTPKRKAVLSPELDEILHMLKSLENDQDGPQGQTR
jgi:hypothetical protein